MIKYFFVLSNFFSSLWSDISSKRALEAFLAPCTIDEKFWQTKMNKNADNFMIKYAGNKNILDFKITSVFIGNYQQFING